MMKIVFALVPLLGVACSDRVELAPKTAEAPTKAASQPASRPAANPHGEAPPSKFAGGDPFSGLLTLADGLSEKDVNPGDILFIMARQSQGGGRAGSLVAVKKISNAKFPLRYEIGPKDLMVMGRPFNGPFIVHARLDRDKNPMTRTPEDLYASFAKEVATGQKEVNLVLKKGQAKTATPDLKPVDKGAASQPSSP